MNGWIVQQLIYQCNNSIPFGTGCGFPCCRMNANTTPGKGVSERLMLVGYECTNGRRLQEIMNFNRRPLLVSYYIISCDSKVNRSIHPTYEILLGSKERVVVLRYRDRSRQMCLFSDLAPGGLTHSRRNLFFGVGRTQLPILKLRLGLRRTLN
jgi:hypothetical protein